jgi:ribosomal protein S18 acetylase RimI-like enzyme
MGPLPSSLCRRYLGIADERGAGGREHSPGESSTMSFMLENVVLEPATREQADAAAPLMYDTDPHLFGHFFGGDRELALRYFATQWRQERSLFSHCHCTVAVARGALLGIELGYDAKTQAAVARDTGRHSAQILTPEQLAHLREAVNYVRYLVPPVPDDAYYVLHLAAARDARGRGVGALLLTAAFDRARRNGYRVCQLDVASDNPAVRFYGRMGMETLSESRVLPLQEHGIASHYRMVRDLRSDANGRS